MPNYKITGEGIFGVMVLFGVVGACISFGINGTFQSLFLGFGIGAIVAFFASALAIGNKND